MLPEELLDIILSRLPFAAQRRFRCVCKKWRGVQSVPPLHTALSQAEDQAANFYCESERKWFNLPSDNLPTFQGKLLTDLISGYGQQSAGLKGEGIDVEGGLVCYHYDVGGRFWFWICNPLGTSMCRLIDPTHSRRNPPKPPKVKLLVDRANKTFKIIALLDRLPSTVVYKPTTSCWYAYIDSHPRFRSLELFSWENVIHAYSAQLKLGHQGTLLAAFSIETGEWAGIEVEIPSSENGVPTHQQFVTDSNQLLLVLFSNKKRPRPYLSVWKLLGSSSTSDRRIKWANWEQVILGVEGAIVDLAGQQLTSLCCGPEYMCFRFSDDRIKKDGFKMHKCVRYSFAARSWSMVQWPETGGSGGNFTLYNWEPNLDIDPSLRIA